jgi:hypothetical protein
MRKPGEKPSVVSMKEPKPPRRPLQEVILARRSRRKCDLTTLDGVLRESGRIFKDLADKRIPIEEADALGRAILRHHAILASAEQQKVLIEQLAELRAIRSATSPVLEWDAIDGAKLDGPKQPN